MIDGVWLAHRHDGSALVTITGATVVTMLLLVASALALLSFAFKRLANPLILTADFMHSMVYVFVFGAFLAPFTSLMASIDRPLIDAALERADRLLGFDYLAASDWVAGHAIVDHVFTGAYYSFLWQAPFILLFGSYARPGERNAEIIWLYIISVLTCVVLSGALPATGRPGVLGMQHIDELNAIRGGHWTLMSANGGGIVTFPSVHAVLAVIYSYVARHRWWALLAVAPLNLVMLISTPTVGGHYLADVIAGIVIAWASIGLERAVRRRHRRISVSGMPATAATSACDAGKPDTRGRCWRGCAPHCVHAGTGRIAAAPAAPGPAMTGT